MDCLPFRATRGLHDVPFILLPREVGSLLFFFPLRLTVLKTVSAESVVALRVFVRPCFFEADIDRIHVK